MELVVVEELDGIGLDGIELDGIGNGLAGSVHGHIPRLEDDTAEILILWEFSLCEVLGGFGFSGEGEEGGNGGKEILVDELLDVVEIGEMGEEVKDAIKGECLFLGIVGNEWYLVVGQHGEQVVVVGLIWFLHTNNIPFEFK